MLPYPTGRPQVVKKYYNLKKWARVKDINHSDFNSPFNGNPVGPEAYFSVFVRSVEPTLPARVFCDINITYKVIMSEPRILQPGPGSTVIE